MAHIVAEPCFDCKYTDCVVVCPVDCFYEGAQMLYIHPEECIDCEACVPECPVEAIFHEDNLPDEWKEFTALERRGMSQVPGDHREERRSRRRIVRQEPQAKVRHRRASDDLRPVHRRARDRASQGPGGLAIVRRPPQPPLRATLSSRGRGGAAPRLRVPLRPWASRWPKAR